MKKNLILYSISTAINKGIVLLFFPFLTILLTLEDFGKWNLVIVISSLLVPILSLNGAAAILREGSQDKRLGFTILKYYNIITLLIGVIMSSLVAFLDLQYWILYAFIIASFEAVLLLYLTYLRTLDKAIEYFSIILFKTLLLFLIILYAYYQKISLYDLLLYHSLVVGVFAFVLSFIVFIKKNLNKKFVFSPIFIFSLVLIPHGISQWIMSSSDRLILEWLSGSYEVGIYSLSYNIAMILMLINSAIALSIPPYMIKNIDRWKNENYDHKLMEYYTIFSSVLFFIVVSLYSLDKYYFNILGYYGQEMIPMIFIIYLSIYFLGLYYIYANYLFFHKQAYIISKATLYSATFNIVGTILFVYFFGTIGAAFGTLLAYIYYLYYIRKETLKFEPLLKIPLAKHISVFLLVTSFISLGFYNV